MRVRAGQGVVLLCGPPPHSGGKTAHFQLNENLFQPVSELTSHLYTSTTVINHPQQLGMH